MVAPPNPAKLRLIDAAFAGRSFDNFADLGGVWEIDGGYTFHILDTYPVKSGTLVDTNLNEAVRTRAQAYDNLRLIHGDFTSKEVAGQINADLVLLFDVLLHQVNPDWDDVLETYAAKAKSFLVFNPQFTGPRTTRLVDLGEDEYFKNVPVPREDPTYAGLFDRLDAPHPQHGKPWRDVHNIWQWGITDEDLRARMAALSFEEVYYEDCGLFYELPTFEYHAFHFQKIDA